MDMIERSTSLESIPKDLLLKLQNYRAAKPECKRSKEDREVEQCLQDLDTSPPSPKSTLSDDVFIKYPPRHSESDEIDEKRSQCSYGYQAIVSPQPDRESYRLYDDQSDWMLADRMKSRSPPISPNHGNRFQGNCVRLSPLCDKNRVQNPIDRTPVKFHSPGQSILQNVEPVLNRTPIKTMSTSKECEFGRQTSPDVSSITMSQDKHYLQRSPLGRPLAVGGSILKVERSSSPYSRDIPDPRVHSPSYYHQSQAQYMEELSRRGGAKKQLFFEVPYGRPISNQETEGYDAMCYSPKKGRFRANSDSELAASFGENFDDEDSRLISKFLAHLNKRKRKMADRFDSDYEDEAVMQAKRKRKELERRMNVNYLKQLEADVSMLNNKLRQPEPRPENCSCAIMERQFLQMAENAYKNIRRQDSTADGFAQFRKELNETNEILKESLEVMQNMRDLCEHRQLLRNLN